MGLKNFTYEGFVCFMEEILSSFIKENNFNEKFKIYNLWYQTVKSNKSRIIIEVYKRDGGKVKHKKNIMTMFNTNINSIYVELFTGEGRKKYTYIDLEDINKLNEFKKDLKKVIELILIQY